MATVRFSGELRSEIRSRAHDTFDARLRDADEFHNYWGQRMYDHAFREYYPKMQALPINFFTQTTELYLDEILNREGERLARPNCTFKLASAMPLPKEYPKEFKFRGSWNLTRIDYLCDDGDAFDEELCEYFIARQKRIDSVIKQREEFIENVMKVCDSFATLAPALKAWTPLWDLIPNEYRERHLEVTERKSAASKTADLLNEVDLSTMTATVVSSKLVR